MHRLARLWRLIGIVLLALAPVEAAWAHAQLLHTAPAESAVLATAPKVISLEFNEPVSPLAIKLVSPDGSQIDLIEQTTGGATVTVQVPQASQGTHVLSWRVVSTDGHPIAGSLVFSIGQVTGASTVDVSGDRVVSVLLWAGKALLFIAMFVGIGGVVFLSVAELPQTARLSSVVASIAGLAAAPVMLGLQGLDALGLGLSAFFDGSSWSTALSTSYGATAIAAMVGFALSLGALMLPAGRVASAIGLLAGTLAALSLTLSGHASAAEPQWLTRPAVFLHIAGILFWVGALLPLWLCLGDRSAAADRALAGFSRGIPFAVAPLVLSGLVLAFVQMGAPGPQWLSPYGFILGTKLALLAALFGLALWNRQWLTVPALAGDALARHRLRGSIRLEAIIVLVILGLVAGWRFTPPPRALAVAVASAPIAEPVVAHLMDDDAMAMVMVSPGSVGPVRLDIMLTDLEGTPIEAQDIGITLSSPSLGIEPFKADAVLTETGWLVEGLTIPVPGVWLLDLDIRASRFELTRMQGEIDIP